ncbi:TipAS antibiotic-recognition domain-containing protein [Lacinutrix iliipiscaria]|uniref:TipAS antibiotic-recognition domain-containing protein n=1 Tax=Lacinutrix iliipiscaria TaxID=1230532 RepID=A0ABW5WN44_9FLAO
MKNLDNFHLHLKCMNSVNKKLKLIVLMLCVTLSSMAQQKLEKVSQSINVSNDVVIDLNTSYTNIEIETWNKDIIEIEAYMESDKLSKEELQKVFDHWKVLVDGSKALVTIETEGLLNSWSNNGIALFDENSLDALKELEFKLADIPEIPIIEGLMESLHLENMPKIPNLPDLPDGMNNFNFDYDKYKKEGQSYLDKWGKEYEEKYGREYSQKMKAWAENFDEEEWTAYEKKMEAWGEKFGEEFGEKFGKDMEEWGEAFGKRMEEWGENFEQQLQESGFEESMEAWGEALGKRIEEHLEGLNHDDEDVETIFSSSSKSNSKVKKTIKIKMPKKAKLKMNVRHGELKIASVINNAKANISHSSLTAQSIDGSQTSINVSYGTVKIINWNAGELKLNYVDHAKIDSSNTLVLSSNSSNVNIKNVLNNAIIDGSFGDLVIGNISNSFKNINLVLENSEANLKLPKGNYSLFYKGTKSFFNDENTSSKTINNYPNTDNNNQTIVINAKYSNVVAQ